MSNTKKIFIAIALLISCAQLAGLTHNVPTGNKLISCTLNTLSRNKLSQLIGKFAPYYKVVGTEETSGTSTSFSWFGGGLHTHSHSSHKTIKQKVDPFKEILGKVMAVVMTIENNSAKAIYYSQHELRGASKGFIPSSTACEELYKPLIKYHRDLLIVGILQAVAGGIFTAISGVVSVAYLFASFKADNQQKYRGTEIERETTLFGRDRYKAKDHFSTDKEEAIGGCAALAICAIPCGIVTGVGIYNWVTASKTIDLARKKQEEVENFASHYRKRKGPSSASAYPSDQERVKLGPNQVSRHLFLFDLSKVDRDFLDNATPIFEYKVKS